MLEKLHNTQDFWPFRGYEDHKQGTTNIFWSKFRDDVIRWCKRCSLCASKSKKNNKALIKHEETGEPLQRVGIDIIGPLPETDLRNCYIVVIVDYFSRWIEAYGIPDHTALTVADKFVLECLCRFGAPTTVTFRPRTRLYV